jgi:hypothetical protein
VNDPRRLLHDTPGALEAELLRSVAVERPSFEHRARVKQAMGLTPALSIPPAAVSMSGGKLALFGLVAAGAVAAILARGTFRHDAPAPSPALEMVASPSPTVTAAEPIAAELAPVSDQQVLPSAGATPSPLPRATAISPSRPRDSKKAAPEAAPVSNVQDQIALIDEAHAALKRHDASTAVAAVDTYASKFPDGLFDQEALVIRIEALDQNGSHARAASMARTFLAKHPASPHAKRLERITGN